MTENSTAASRAIDFVYERLDGSVDLEAFSGRHRIASLGVLTILNESDAAKTVSKFRTEIAGRRVVEIGSGVGYLALEMAKFAKSVVAIENDPAWSWLFTKFLYSAKTTNLTWVFGLSSNVSLPVDVAVICSRSGLAEMIAEGRRLAPVIILAGFDEIIIADRDDTILDCAADYTKQRIDELFSEVEDALFHPEKRAAYEALTEFPPDGWEKIAAEFESRK